MKVLPVLLLMVAATAGAQSRDSCQQRVVKICADAPDSGACQLLAQSGPETVTSINTFLESLRDIDPEMQQTLICARFVRLKTIRMRIDLTQPLLQKCPYVPCGVRFDSTTAARIGKLAEIHGELSRLKQPVSSVVDVEVIGRVSGVEAEWPSSHGYFENNNQVGLIGWHGYEQSRYWRVSLTYVITFSDSRIEKIKASYGSGSYETVLKALNAHRNKAYSYYRDIGLEGPAPKKKP